MAKYEPTDIPPGESKPINQMTAVEYRSWIGRCGGRSASKRKLKSQRKASKAKKPGLSRYHEIVKQVAAANLETVAAIKALGTKDYAIDDAKADKILAAARKYRGGNPL